MRFWRCTQTAEGTPNYGVLMEVCSTRTIFKFRGSEMPFPAFFRRIYSVNKKENAIASCIFYFPSVSSKVRCLREKEKKKLKQKSHQGDSKKGR